MLYSDDEERLFNATRAILLNGIEDSVVKGDLASRCITLQLAPIADTKRRREEVEFWAEFAQDHAVILGALLNGVAHGLRELPHVRLEKKPRMADFAKWGTACEGAFWGVGTFMRAYDRNRASKTRDVIEADMVASAVQRLMTRGDATNPWVGTATALLADLEDLVGEKESKRKEWPGAPNKLSGRLRRVATPLRRVGIEIESVREGRARTITITRRERVKVGKVSSSYRHNPTAPPPRKPLKTQGFFASDDSDDSDDRLQTSPLDAESTVRRLRDKHNSKRRREPGDEG